MSPRRVVSSPLPEPAVVVASTPAPPPSPAPAPPVALPPPEGPALWAAPYPATGDVKARVLVDVAIHGLKHGEVVIIPAVLAHQLHAALTTP